MLIAAAQGSGSLPAAIAAALNTLGGVHAPIQGTYEFIGGEDPSHRIGELIEDGYKIPGWGNSFHKGEPDPVWENVGMLLGVTYMGGVIGKITEVLHRNGKHIYPNPSAYTAAAAIELGMPASLAPWLVIAGRMEAWATLFHLSQPQP